MATGKIDDPVEASFAAWQSEAPTLGDHFAEIALHCAGLKFPLAAIVETVKNHFAIRSRVERVEYLIDGMRLRFQMEDEEKSKSAERIKAINAKLEDDRFKQGVMAACEEATRTSSKKKIRQMASVLVGCAGLTQTIWAAPNEDIETMIRDLAQLGDTDIRVLEILATVHAQAISRAPNLNAPHTFSAETPALRAAVAKSGIVGDDFLSACERLRGFGLAAEVLRNTSHMAPEDFCYRPTRRGLALLDYIRTAIKE